jgi:hypothetical protein
MLTKNGVGFFTLGIILAVACGNVYAQQTVYKWVDEDGVVHFSELPPDESAESGVKVITTDPSPPPPKVLPAQTTTVSPSASETDVENLSTQPETQIIPLVEEIDITEMSLVDLDSRCEDAREERLAPLREAEIAKCVRTEIGDQAWCDNFWSDYGEPIRTLSGLTHRMFYDLPKCTEAWDERSRRGI